jgi:hypothetical protein
MMRVKIRHTPAPPDADSFAMIFRPLHNSLGWWPPLTLWWSRRNLHLLESETTFRMSTLHAPQYGIGRRISKFGRIPVPRTRDHRHDVRPTEAVVGRRRSHESKRVMDEGKNSIAADGRRWHAQRRRPTKSTSSSGKTTVGPASPFPRILNHEVRDRVSGGRSEHATTIHRREDDAPAGGRGRA